MPRGHVAVYGAVPAHQKEALKNHFTLSAIKTNWTWDQGVDDLTVPHLLLTAERPDPFPPEPNPFWLKQEEAVGIGWISAESALKQLEVDINNPPAPLP